MKTYNHLFEKIIDKDNIRKAVLRAATGKRKKATVRKALSRIDALVEKWHLATAWVSSNQTYQWWSRTQETLYCLP